MKHGPTSFLVFLGIVLVFTGCLLFMYWALNRTAMEQELPRLAEEQEKRENTEALCQCANKKTIDEHLQACLADLEICNARYRMLSDAVDNDTLRCDMAEALRIKNNQ